MKLWGGRFEKDTSKAMDDFHSSIHFDWQLYEQDIKGSKAHVRMLYHIGILKEEEKEKILEGLDILKEDIKKEKVFFNEAHEDIHMNIEALLTERIGSVAGKIHTARSRNDQVVLDLKLFIKEQTNSIMDLIGELIFALVEISENHVDTIMPGYTHLQPAQPIRLAFHLMSYVEMLKRDYSRFENSQVRLDQMPLGAGAFCGTGYETDRNFLAEQLGFKQVSLNAMDSVSDRDFAIEFLSAGAMVMMHLSRFCEDVILWNTKAFGFIHIGEQYSTGSSIMPQKKNPDVAELIRGKTGTVYGHLMGLLAVMKGLPLSYNKDMQEDKIPVFEGSKNIKQSLNMFKEMMKTIEFNKEAMEKATKTGFLNATDMADYLVRKGMPFREAHGVIGGIVVHCEKAQKTLEDLSLETLKTFSPLFDETVYDAIQMKHCIEAKKSYGSTSKKEVLYMIEKTKRDCWNWNKNNGDTNL